MMRSCFDGDSEAPAVSFRPLTDEEFFQFQLWSTGDYARELMETGRYQKEEALAEASAEFLGALPQGAETPGHFLLAAVGGEGKPVGVVWVEAAEREAAFLEEFVVVPAYRRRGYGLAMLLELEKVLCVAGKTSLSLHVFSENSAAIALYQKAGFAAGEHLEKTGGFYMKKSF